MASAKNPVFIGLHLENCCLVGGSTFGWGEKIWWGESTGGGGMRRFSAGGDSTPIEGKP